MERGDTLRIETEVLDVRESRSRPDQGIVAFAHRALPIKSYARRNQAPSQPCSSPPKVNRQPVSHPVVCNGECGHRSPMRAGSRFVP